MGTNSEREEGDEGRENEGPTQEQTQRQRDGRTDGQTRIITEVHARRLSTARTGTSDQVRNQGALLFPIIFKL